jgi:hypothetical protein
MKAWGVSVTDSEESHFTVIFLIGAQAAESLESQGISRIFSGGPLHNVSLDGFSKIAREIVCSWARGWLG